jgi:predicted ferric reductase
VSEGSSGTPGSGVITEIPVKKHKKVRLSFDIRSKGNLSDVLKLLNNLGKYFENINIHIDVKVENGEIKADEYEKIKEGLAQVNADLIEEEIE